MLLDRPLLDAVALGALAVALLALGLSVLLLTRLARLRTAYDALVAGRDGPGRREPPAAGRSDPPGALRHVAVVRYDAFADGGGRLSFSAALLDDGGDGLVLSCLNGRSETRSYAKAVAGGRSEQALSPEEQEAISRALGPAAAAPAGARRSG